MVVVSIYVDAVQRSRSVASRRFQEMQNYELNLRFLKWPHIYVVTGMIQTKESTFCTNVAFPFMTYFKICYDRTGLHFLFECIGR